MTLFTIVVMAREGGPPSNRRSTSKWHKRDDYWIIRLRG
jgi:hypothetical protein